MRILSTLAILVLSAGRPAASGPDEQRPPLIDMHLHAHVPDVPPGSAPPCRPELCRIPGEATASSTESFQKTLQAMKRYNIVKGFLSGDLDTVQAWVKAAPDRFIASPFILQPARPGMQSLPGFGMGEGLHPDPETLRAEYREGRLSGMGEIAAPEAQKRDIFYNNAARFLRLQEFGGHTISPPPAGTSPH